GIPSPFGGTDWEPAPLSSAEIFDQRTGEFLPAVGGLKVARYEHTATRLASGKVLLVGGIGDPLAPRAASETSEIYSPVTQTFAFGPDLLLLRYEGHAATLLADGRVLITGGYSSGVGYGAVDEAEIYDPSSNRFTGAGSMTTPRRFHTATLLADGRVLIAGGYDASGNVTNTAEVF